MRSPLLTSLLLMLAVLAPGAGALVITDTASFTHDVRASDTGGQSGGQIFIDDTVLQTVFLDRFDAALGTLTDVSISFASGFEWSFGAGSRDNEGTCGGFGNATAGCTRISAAVGVRTLSVALDAASVSSPELRQTERGCTTFLTRTCGVGHVDSGPFDGLLDLAGFGLAGIGLDYFIGDDPLEVVLTNDNYLFVNCATDSGEVCNAGTRSEWSGIVSVDYTYDALSTPVPAPAPAGLLLGALALFAARRSN